jgi:hypothetical protein
MGNAVSRAAGRRGLIVVALLVLLLLAVADLLRQRSFLRSLFGVTPASRQEQIIEGVRQRISVVDGSGVGVAGEAPRGSGTLPG